MSTAGRQRGTTVVVEMVRLGVVIAMTAAGIELGSLIVDRQDDALFGALVGALVGYLLGGVGGRALVRRVDAGGARLQRVESATLVAGTVGGMLAGGFASLLLVPLALLPGRTVTLPVGSVVVVVAAYAGIRLGATRGGDLGRYLGVKGRIEVSSPARGGGVKVVDSSALVDGRILGVARSGWLEGTLVVPRFVLHELQGLADSEESQRRDAGRRGLDVVRTLQQEHVVVVEVTDEDPVEVDDVDAKLVALVRRRDCGLVTTDTALARVAELSGLPVLDLRSLAEAVRPPVVPGQRIEVEVTRTGSEPGQGVGYLPDGTMVVVERAAGLVGDTVEVDVTSINQTSRGRMLFGVAASERARR